MPSGRTVTATGRRGRTLPEGWTAGPPCLAAAEGFGTIGVTPIDETGSIELGPGGPPTDRGRLLRTRGTVRVRRARGVGRAGSAAAELALHTTPGRAQLRLY